MICMRMPPFQLGRGDQKVIHDLLICQGYLSTKTIQLSIE